MFRGPWRPCALSKRQSLRSRRTQRLCALTTARVSNTVDSPPEDAGDTTEGYAVHVYRRETQSKYAVQGGDPEFFTEEKNLTPFTKAELKRLTERLELLGFRARSAWSSFGRMFFNDALTAEALLTPGGLYLRADEEKGIGKILMFASESVGKKLAKYDPQTDEWE